MKQNALLELSSEYLRAACGATTATGLSHRREGSVSHDQVTRHWAGKKKTAADLWGTVKPCVRKVQSAAGVLSSDDRSEEKPYTDENDLVGWQYDHAKAARVTGSTFLTALSHSRDGSFPVGFPLLATTEP
jgi:hypothetical protein